MRLVIISHRKILGFYFLVVFQMHIVQALLMFQVWFMDSVNHRKNMVMLKLRLFNSRKRYPGADWFFSCSLFSYSLLIFSFQYVLPKYSQGFVTNWFSQLLKIIHILICWSPIIAIQKYLVMNSVKNVPASMKKEMSIFAPLSSDWHVHHKVELEWKYLNFVFSFKKINRKKYYLGEGGGGKCNFQ